MISIPIVSKCTWLHSIGIFWHLLDIYVTFWVQFWYAPIALKTSLTCRMNTINYGCSNDASPIEGRRCDLVVILDANLAAAWLEVGASFVA